MIIGWSMHDHRMVNAFFPTQQGVLQDSAGGRPSYNLRTLGRALEYAAAMAPLYGLQRSLWDGVEMSFATQLDLPSQSMLHRLMLEHLLHGDASMLKVCESIHGWSKF